MVIGAGVGGLVAAACLARAGIPVTVLEAQNYLGGCAGTFYRQAYRFDAGATVAAGFGPNGPMTALANWLGVDFGARMAKDIMRIHAPGKFALTLPSTRELWHERRAEVFGQSREVEAFWAWQQRTADVAWSMSDHLPPWPATSASEWMRCVGAALAVAAKRPATLARPNIVLDVKRPLSVHLPKGHDALRTFIDGLLLITSQATSEAALALYGAAALDFPWRGVAHLENGIGGLSETLAGAIRQAGGQIFTRSKASRIVRERSAIVGVETTKGQFFPAEHVIANLTPWNIRELLDVGQGLLPEVLGKLDRPERDIEGAWGAMVVHAGVDESVIDPNGPLHHQVHLGPPRGEGNTSFISVSPEWDRTRAPEGKRAVTITTHTKLSQWWAMLERDPDEYAFNKATYQDRLLEAAEVAIPGFRRGLHVAYAGTPVTYAHYTGRKAGWVGGMPQTDLGNFFPAHLDFGLDMVGDAVFPGQSTLAVALSAIRVVGPLLERVGVEQPLAAARQTAVGS